MEADKLSISHKIKLNNGIEMPIFGLGMYRAESGKELVEAVAYALGNANYLQLDTAQYYKNEKDAGEGIRASGVPRENIFVVTKLFTTKDGREGAINTIETSLSLMNIGYIDQYLLHCPQGGKVLECYDVLLEYQNKGLIRSVGVSNFGVKHLEALKNSGRPLPQVNQIELHPWCTNQDIVDWCRQNNVAVVGYSPLTQTKKFSNEFVQDLSKKYNKTPAQILIRWSLQKGYVTIPKTVHINWLDENANSFDFSLSDEEMNTLTSFGNDVKENVCWDPTKNDMETHFGPLI